MHSHQHPNLIPAIGEGDSWSWRFPRQEGKAVQTDYLSTFAFLNFNVSFVFHAESWWELVVFRIKSVRGSGPSLVVLRVFAFGSGSASVAFVNV
jgi:hypothetical protein